MSRITEEKILAAIGEIDEKLLLEADELRNGASLSKSPAPHEEEDRIVSFEKRRNAQRRSARVVPILLSAAACVLIVFALGRAGIVPGILGRKGASQSAAPAAAPAAAAGSQAAASAAYEEAEESADDFEAKGSDAENAAPEMYAEMASAEVAPAEEAAAEESPAEAEPAAETTEAMAEEVPAAAQAQMASVSDSAGESMNMAAAEAMEAPAPAPAAAPAAAAPAAAAADPAAGQAQEKAAKAMGTARTDKGAAAERTLILEGAAVVYEEAEAEDRMGEADEALCGEAVLKDGNEQWFRLTGRSDNEFLICRTENEQGNAVYTLWKRKSE